MTVKAITISDKFFFWRCGDCGWESERLPVSHMTETPAHECDSKVRLAKQMVSVLSSGPESE
jgi:hypothetical protein